MPEPNVENAQEKPLEERREAPLISHVADLKPRPKRKVRAVASAELRRHEFDRRMDWLSQATTWFGVAVLACFTYLSVRELAGKQTQALFDMMFKMSADRWILGMVAALTSIGYVRERRLRRRMELGRSNHHRRELADGTWNGGISDENRGGGRP